MTALLNPPHMDTAQVQRAPLDALSRIFLALGKHYNTNSNQILIVQGHLDYERLRAAVHRAVQRFDHVLIKLDGSNNMWPAEAVPVRTAQFEGTCTLQDQAFRAVLLQLSDRYRINWHNAPATQVFLISSTDRKCCCVYLNSAHAAADAASDGMLIEEIIRQYAHPSSTTPSPVYVPLMQVLPQWFTYRAKISRWLSAWWDIAKANLSHDSGLSTHQCGRYGYSPQQSTADFYTSVLTTAEIRDAYRAAKTTGVSLNTLFAAALLRTMQTGKSHLKRRGLRLSIAVSFRSLLPVARQGHTFGNHIITCTVRQPEATTTRDFVQALDQQVKQIRQSRLSTEVGRLELALPFMGFGILQPIMRRLMARAQITNVCYSNPGVIKHDFSTFGSDAHPVVEYTGLGCLVSPYDLMFYTTTVNGHTQIDALYRRHCFDNIEEELIDPVRKQLRHLIIELLSQSTVDAIGEEELA